MYIKIADDCGELVGMKQYSRKLADSICDSCILSGIRGYFREQGFINM